MGWFKRIFGIENEEKTKDKRNNHTFDDEEREISKEITRKKAELRKLQLEREDGLHKLEIEKKKLELQKQIEETKYALEEFEEDDYEDDYEEDNPMDTTIKNFLSGILLKSQNNTANSNITPESNGVVLSDEQLKTIWNNTPQQYKLISKQMNDEQIKTFIKQQMPTANEETLNRALYIVRNT